MKSVYSISGGKIRESELISYLADKDGSMVKIGEHSYHFPGVYAVGFEGEKSNGKILYVNKIIFSPDKKENSEKFRKCLENLCKKKGMELKIL